MFRTTLLGTLFIVLCSPTVFAAFGDCNVAGLTIKQKYLCHRFATFNYYAAKYYVDFKQVAAVLQDGHSQLWKQHGAAYCNESCLNHYWIFFNNGSKLLAANDDAPKKKWEAYLDFLHNNPEFMNVP